MNIRINETMIMEKPCDGISMDRLKFELQRLNRVAKNYFGTIRDVQFKVDQVDHTKVIQVHVGFNSPPDSIMRFAEYAGKHAYYEIVAMHESFTEGHMQEVRGESGEYEYSEMTSIAIPLVKFDSRVIVAVYGVDVIHPPYSGKTDIEMSAIAYLNHELNIPYGHKLTSPFRVNDISLQNELKKIVELSEAGKILEVPPFVLYEDVIPSGKYAAIAATLVDHKTDLNVTIDVEAWFEQSSDQSIKDLIESVRAGDGIKYIMSILQWFEDRQHPVILQALEKATNHKKDAGHFSVAINGDQVKDWVCKNRPDLATEIYPNNPNFK